MSEETITEEVQTEQLPDNQQEVTGEESQETTEQETSVNLEKWEKVAPELAGHIKDLSPEAREEILLERLAAKSADATSQNGSSQSEATAQGQEAQTPPAMQTPSIDPESIVNDIGTAIEDSDSAAAKRSMQQIIDYIAGTTSLVNEALTENQQEMAALRRNVSDVTTPAEFERLARTIEGVELSDIPSAIQIQQTQAGTSIEAALKFAALNRYTSKNSKTKPPAGEDAKRKAAAIAASQQSGGPRAVGSQVGTIPMNEQGYRKMLEEDESRGTK